MAQQLDTLDFSLASYADSERTLAFHASGRAEAEAWQRELRSSLVDLIGGFPAEAVPAIAQGDGEGRVPDLHP